MRMLNLKKIALIIASVPLAGCNFFSNEVAVTCVVTETIIQNSGSNESAPQVQPKIGKAFRFFKETVPVESLFVLDTRGSEDKASGERISKTVWIVEENGRKLIPRDAKIIANKSTTQNRIIVAVDDNHLGYSEYIENNIEGGPTEKSRSTYFKAEYNINRLTGDLSGTQVDIFEEMSFFSRFSGSCKKTEKKF
jgi:hypothetical protein